LSLILLFLVIILFLVIFVIVQKRQLTIVLCIVFLTTVKLDSEICLTKCYTLNNIMIFIKQFHKYCKINCIMKLLLVQYQLWLTSTVYAVIEDYIKGLLHFVFIWYLKYIIGLNALSVQFGFKLYKVYCRPPKLLS